VHIAVGTGLDGIKHVWASMVEIAEAELAFPAELRKIIYTTSAIESLNYQLRRTIENRGHFPGDHVARGATAGPPGHV
jgi:transposase-like protein